MQFSYGVFLPYMMRELGISLSAATAGDVPPDVEKGEVGIV